ncbi:hypothetical protein HNP38_001189 [Chryseobacterium defluvii]|uniref:C1q domain-containing protein n=1 Tax=Chryseobacterium defluvii TaxID=160396 RepID=A0A840KD41_9FLAO|nr:hypothetical protein [Chryseobacterium defluvii]MBB4805917.1 hypothetical protein [Chryseobacterium defluvii]
MIKKLFLFAFITGFAFMNAQSGNVGINTSSPTNTLHVKGNGTSDPLRLESLLTAQNTAGTLVADANGVVRLRNANSISSIKASGNVTLSVSGTYYPINNTAAPTEEYDNLGEFSGNTFTASQAGLYMVTHLVQYTQQNSGDGYLGHAVILKNGVITENNAAKIAITETSGVATAESYAEATTMIKLNAGDTLSFQARTYGAGASVNASYRISITRLD